VEEIFQAWIPKKRISTTTGAAALENMQKFPEWREYLYLNVLGFPPEPVYIENWPQEIPQPKTGM
jgi:hypothetical protein